jgi:hypothetical protein
MAGGERLPMKDEIPPLADALWVLWLSWWGAATAFAMRARARLGEPFNLCRFIADLVVELFAASFFGYLAYLWCDLQGIDIRITAIVIALNGHLGPRAIFRLRAYARLLKAPLDDLAAPDEPESENERKKSAKRVI